MQTQTSSAISLRPLQDKDLGFAVEVFASTRERERSAVAWKPGEWKSFVLTQFAAQCSYYTEHFSGSEQVVILADGLSVGRAWVHRCAEEIRLLDIAILPKHRCCGTGTEVIRGLQQEASNARLPLRHSVELENPRARALYERLGFVAIQTSGLHTLMEWNP